MSPVADAEEHDAPGLIDEPLPGVAAEVDDLVVGFEDAVGEPVVAHELPDVFLGVEFGTFGRQRDERDVGGNAQASRKMPSGLIGATFLLNVNQSTSS